MDEIQTIELKPQKGNQEKYLATPADITFYGGHAGCGKSFGLILESSRNVDNSGYRGIIFRQSYKQLTMAGGLWDKSWEIFPHLDGEGTSGNLLWSFPSGAEVSLSYLDSEQDKYIYQGAEFCFIGYDELTHFSEGQFFYMLSRNRSTCGVRPYIRATCNPDADSWVANFISWWIDQETGLAIPERSGVIRYFLRRNDAIVWAGSRAELAAKYPEDANDIKSFTFIVGFLEDNPILMQKDPGYLGNLKALQMVERERQLGGNWKIQYTSGNMFRSDWFPIVAAAPRCQTRVRFWDRAATAKTTNNDPDWTAGVLLSKDKYGQFFVEDLVYFQGSALEVENAITTTAAQDGPEVIIGQYQDPGQAGVDQARAMVRKLAGYRIKTVREDRENNKVKASGPVSAQAEAGNIKLIRANWNKDFINNHINFPDGRHDDIVAAMIGAFRVATKPQSWGSGEC